MDKYVLIREYKYSLAMAEMTTLVATVFRHYQTSIAPGFEDISPGITARVETFYDDRFSHVQVSLLRILRWDGC